MRRSRHGKTTGALQTKNAPASPPLDPLRTGMPALDSITGVEECRKGKKVFSIIHTNEVDAYEHAPSKAIPKKP